MAMFRVASDLLILLINKIITNEDTRKISPNAPSRLNKPSNKASRINIKAKQAQPIEITPKRD
ncbi:hypothetical protein CA473_21070, partial [Salmonella enterica]|nr:hypothetical protein [Salmonella enterica]